MENRLRSHGHRWFGHVMRSDRGNVSQQKVIDMEAAPRATIGRPGKSLKK